MVRENKTDAPYFRHLIPEGRGLLVKGECRLNQHYKQSQSTKKITEDSAEAYLQMLRELRLCCVKDESD